MAKSDLTAQRLRELLHYDPQTGLFKRLKPHGGRGQGGPLGNKANCGPGYCQMSIDGRLYYAHRLAWLHFYGQWPKHYIDHIDGNKVNNRIANLRDVDQGRNLQNQHKRRGNTTGFAGVHVLKSETAPFQARIKVGGKTVYLGCFDSPEKANAAYIAAKARMHVIEAGPTARDAGSTQSIHQREPLRTSRQPATQAPPTPVAPL